MDSIRLVSRCRLENGVFIHFIGVECIINSIYCVKIVFDVRATRFFLLGTCLLCILHENLERFVNANFFCLEKHPTNSQFVFLCLEKHPVLSGSYLQAPELEKSHWGGGGSGCYEENASWSRIVASHGSPT